MAQQIVDSGYPLDIREPLFLRTMDEMIKQMHTPVVKAVDGSGTGTEVGVTDAMAGTYAEMFPEQELRDLLKFVSAPSGQSFFSKSPEILPHPKFAAAAGKYMGEILVDFPKARVDLMNALAQHAERREQS